MTTANVQTIPEFYDGKNIFLTGATGFIGKVLIEKILRSCPNTKSIYCLARAKKGKSANERLKALFNEQLYEKLREEQPNFTDKIHPIIGDITEPELGISEEEQTFLKENINVVFHSAATIRFDEHLRLAVELNLIGVRKMVQLCKQFKHLEVFLHVSTAYANCDRHHIEEFIYPAAVEPQKIIDMISWMDDDAISQVTPALIQDKPNTYTFTKQLAETLLIQEAGDMPIAIVRPSIVTACWKEPLAGWIDNLNGPSGLYIAAGKGLLRSLKAEHHIVADLIPVDLPVNMMIATAWYTAVHKPAEPLLIHSTSGSINPFTWGEMENVVINYFKRNPMEACWRRPTYALTSNSVIHDYWVFVSHLIPAYLADFACRMIGRKPKMVNLYQRLHKNMQTLEWFILRQWVWTHGNMDMLKASMSQEDCRKFYFDPRALHWPTYIENYCQGTKKYILKEDDSGLPAARAHIKRLRNIRYLFNTVLLVIMWRLLIARSSLARNSWNFVMGLVFKFVRFFRITSTIAH